MKAFIATLCFVALQIFATAQNVIQAEYFLDTDAGFGQNKLVSFTPVADGSFAFTVDLAGVAAGFHKLYIRTKNDNGKWGQTTRRNLEVVASETSNKIVSGEYYFNVDPGFGAGNIIAISPQDSVILQDFVAAVSVLPVGYHKLYGRFKDLYGNWSQAFRRNVQVTRGTNNAVLLVEYFFDNDAAFGNCASVTFANPLPDGTFAFNIANNQIGADADTLFIRVKDSTNGNWSITSFIVRQIVFPLTLLNFSASPLHNIVKLNWETVNEINTAYFHIERSTNGTNFSPTGKVNAKGNTSALTSYNYDDDVSGIHNNKIYYRLKQEDKDGSITYSKVVVVNLNNEEIEFTIRPNPAKGHFTVHANRNINLHNSVLTIRDMAGRTIIKQQLSANETQTIDISALAKGTYIINILTPTKSYTEKLAVE